jgi:hypothetical protein
MCELNTEHGGGDIYTVENNGTEEVVEEEYG